MSELGEMARHYNEIRNRLMNPSNAVFDKGINLRPNRIPPLSPSQLLAKLVLEHQPVCKVTIRIVPKPPIEPVVPRPVRFHALRRAVCRHYNVKWSQIKDIGRNKRICLPRHVLCYLAYCHTGLSMPQIARQLGRKDHTTVLHGRDKIREMLLVDDVLITTIKLIEFEVFAGYYDAPEPILPPMGDDHGKAV